MMSSLNSEATAIGATTCSPLVRLTATPLPWLPSCGLTTTGRPISCAATQASSASSTGGRAAPATPAACSRSWSVPCPGRSIRRWRWCGRFRRPECAAACCPSRTAPGCPRSGGDRECRAPRRPGRWRRLTGAEADVLVEFAQASQRGGRGRRACRRARPGRVLCASSKARRPTASSVYSTTT